MSAATSVPDEEFDSVFLGEIGIEPFDTKGHRIQREPKFPMTPEGLSAAVEWVASQPE